MPELSSREWSRVYADAVLSGDAQSMALAILNHPESRRLSPRTIGQLGAIAWGFLQPTALDRAAIEVIGDIVHDLEALS